MEEVEEERYMACIIIAHGAFLTVNNKSYNPFKNYRHRNNPFTGRKFKFEEEEEEKRTRPREMAIMPNLVDFPINVSLCNFAVPTESCEYPPMKLIALKDEMMRRFNQYEITNDQNMNDELFKNISYVSQRSSTALGVTYNDYPHLSTITKRPEYAERWIYGSRHINKIFTNCDELGIKCGIYVVQNNIGIKNGKMKSFGNGMLFDELINYFVEKYGVNKMYILDISCSEVYNPEMTEKITDREILYNIFNHARRMMRGGKKRKIKNKLKKCKSKKINWKNKKCKSRKNKY